MATEAEKILAMLISDERKRCAAAIRCQSWHTGWNEYTYVFKDQSTLTYYRGGEEVKAT